MPLAPLLLSIAPSLVIVASGPEATIGLALEIVPVLSSVPATVSVAVEATDSVPACVQSAPPTTVYCEKPAYWNPLPSIVPGPPAVPQSSVPPPPSAAPLIVLRDLGPLPGTSLRYTVWKKGTRLTVYGSNQPITPADFNTPGAMITVIPEGYADNDEVLAKATVIIIKMEPGQLKIPTRYNDGVNGPKTLLNSMNWTVDNIVAYSKICTHVGCPAALYEQTTHKILCPCHQSTFDAETGATVLFGPAPRPLPQLPITTDAEGYLVAQSDFQEPIGPSFWERG